MTAREKILKSYSEWTTLSALRNATRFHISSKNDVYPLLNKIPFDEVLDKSRGKIDKGEFNAWHKRVSETIVDEVSKIGKQFGWTAKVLNIYLKTYCYVGDGGRPGIRDCLHPPIDKGLWDGIKNKFKDDKEILDKTHSKKAIKDISSYNEYMTIIEGIEKACEKLNCSLIEIEQLWEGTKILMQEMDI